MSKPFSFLTFTFLIVVSFFLVNLSFGKARDYTFWRDDTFIVWAAKHNKSFVYDSNPSRIRTLGANMHNWFFTEVVGLDSASWQKIGIFFKVVNSLIVFFFVYQLLKSAKAAFIASLIYSSSLGGLEIYTWTRLMAMNLATILLAFAFYIKAGRRINKYFWLAVIFSIISVSLDLWRSIGLLLLIPLWEFLNWFGSGRKETKKDAVRVFVYIFTVGAVALLLAGFITSRKDANDPPVGQVNKVIIERVFREGDISFYAKSLGNLARSPFVTASEEGGLSSGDRYSLVLGYLFIFFTIFFVFLFLRNKNTKLIIPITLMVWVLVFYFINWFYEPFISVGASHRYIATSAAAYVILLTFVIDKFVIKWSLFLTVLLVIGGISGSIKVTDHDYLIRGRQVIGPIWDNIVYSVPPGEKKSVFVIWGSHYLRGYIFDWSGLYPYAYARGINNFDDFPVLTDIKTASKLICDGDTKIHYWGPGGGMVSAKSARDLNKIYGWHLGENGVLEDETSSVRLAVAKTASCLYKTRDIMVNDSIYTISSAYIRNLDIEETKSGLIINWQRNEKFAAKYNYLVYLKDSTGSVFDVKYLELVFEEGSQNAQSIVEFSSRKEMDNFYVKVVLE